MTVRGGEHETFRCRYSFLSPRIYSQVEKKVILIWKMQMRKSYTRKFLGLLIPFLYDRLSVSFGKTKDILTSKVKKKNELDYMSASLMNGSTKFY